MLQLVSRWCKKEITACVYCLQLSEKKEKKKKEQKTCKGQESQTTGCFEDKEIKK